MGCHRKSSWADFRPFSYLVGRLSRHEMSWISCYGTLRYITIPLSILGKTADCSERGYGYTALAEWAAGYRNSKRWGVGF
jgi:hypothetical protein